MNAIGKNEELLNYLSSKKLYILNSELARIDIFSETYTLSIELHLKLIQNGTLLKIKLTNVLEYAFYYRIDKPVYVERCKFFKKDDTFYISLDPYNENEELNENDQDFILCKEIEGYME